MVAAGVAPATEFLDPRHKGEDDEGKMAGRALSRRTHRPVCGDADADGAVGAGGLGQIGYQYGYIGYNATGMNTVLVLLVILVYLIQFSGDRIVRAVTHK